MHKMNQNEIFIFEKFNGIYKYLKRSLSINATENRF